MTSTMKLSLLAGASAMAIGLALTPAPAAAFEEVNWTWNAEVNETVTKTINVAVDLVPTGMVMIEDFQLSVGDVTAISTVTGVYNNQPTEGGTADLGEQTYQFKYGINEGVFDDPATPDFNSPEVTDASVLEACTSGTLGCDGEVSVTIDLGEVEVPASQSFDATTELPEVISTATAVANNTSISSNVSVELHEQQVVTGGIDSPGNSDNNNNNDGFGDDLNLNNQEQATISALSDVSDILNASVDSTATAVANNLTVDLVQDSGTDGLLLADINQWSFADVSATSLVSDVSVNNYTNLGSIDRALVNSAATAVGNNKVISVSGPTVPAVQ